MSQQLVLMICFMAVFYGVGRGLIHQLQRILAPMSDALNRLTASVGAFIATVTANNTELGEIAQALRNVSGQPSVNPEDTAALNSLADRLDAAAATAAAAGEAAKDALPAPATPPTPEASAISVSPTSISGTVSEGGSVEGSFSATGGQEPYTYAGHSDNFADFLVNEDGSYVVGADHPGTGAAVVVATDANGATSPEVSVTIAIS